MFHIYTFTKRAHRKDVVANAKAAAAVLENAKTIDAIMMCIIYDENEMWDVYLNRNAGKPRQEILEG